MPSYFRVRTKNRYGNTGTKTKVSTGWLNGAPLIGPTYSVDPNSGASTVVESVRCEDSTSSSLPYPDHPLTLSRKSIEPCSIMGSIVDDIPTTGWTYDYIYDDYGPAKWKDSAFGPDIVEDVGWNYWEAAALASANPAVPAVDVPLFIFEFKDFPRMLRDLGHVLNGRLRPDTVPGGVLAYKFGWAPLISDLEKLVKLTEEMDKLKSYLTSIREGKKVERTVRTVHTNDGTWSESAEGVTVRFSQSTTIKVWYTLRYAVPADSPIHDLELDRDLRRMVTGVNLSAATIWNAIPWTWLIDYLGNWGKILDAGRGSLRLEPQDLNLMHKTIKEQKGTVVNSPHGLTVEPPNFRSERKLRHIISRPYAKPAFNPLLTQGQIVTLGSLITARALQRAKK